MSNTNKKFREIPKKQFFSCVIGFECALIFLEIFFL